MADMNADLSSGMTPKKKIMLGVTLVFVALIIWQVIGLLGSDHAAIPTATPVIPKDISSSSSSMIGATPVAPSSERVPTGGSPSKETKKSSPSNADASSDESGSGNEEKYMQSLNELESLKIAREIAEMNQAIATAKLATVTAEKNIADLSLKSAPLPVPLATYANGLISQGSPIVPPENPNPIKAASPRLNNDYTVVSVFKQGQQWTAVLGYQGKSFSVREGDVAADGSVVLSINGSGVVLNQNGVPKTLTITSSL